MDNVKLPLQVFERLREDILTKFSVDNGVTVTLQQFHGDKAKEVFAAIYKHPKVAEYLDIEYGKGKGRNLYPMHLYKKKLKDPITLSADYNPVLFLYLGFGDADHYIAHLKREEEETKPIIYKGYYYSFKNHKVRTYYLAINYEKPPNINLPHITIRKYTVEEKYFHDDDIKPVYQGYAYRQQDKLHIIVWAGEDKLKLVFVSGGNPKKKDIMRGIAMGISGEEGRYPLSMETILVKENLELSSDQERDIKRYFYLHRYHFRIKMKGVDLENLKAKGTEVQKLQSFEGFWRVLRFNEDYSKIIKSIFHFDRDYCAFFYDSYYDNGNYQTMVCAINIMEDVYNVRPSLFLTLHPKKGARVLGSVMLKNPKKKEDKTGGKLTILSEHHEYPITKGIVMQRDDSLKEFFESKKKKTMIDYGFFHGENENLEPKKKKLEAEEKLACYTIEEFDKLTMKDDKMKELYNFLCEREAESAYHFSLKR